MQAKSRLSFGVEGGGGGGECALVSGNAVAPHSVTTGSLHSSLRSWWLRGRGEAMRLPVLNSFAASALVYACARQQNCQLRFMKGSL